MIHTGAPGLDDLRVTVERTVEELRPHVRKFDSIIVTGTSGVTVGVPVALALDKPVTILRKPREESHGVAGELLNKHRLGQRALFLDDFISEGRTYARCWRVVEGYGAKVVGAYTYAFGGGWDDPSGDRLAHRGPSGRSKPKWVRRAESNAVERPGWI